VTAAATELARRWRSDMPNDLGVGNCAAWVE
jgi:hypothetical protein